MATQEKETKGTALMAPGLEKDRGGLISPFANAASFESAQRMAKALFNSSLVPHAYQGANNLPNCLIAMEMANRLNASPLMVMQNLDVIHNRPSWRSQFLIATVNASGRFTPLRYRFQGTEGEDNWGCRAYAKDKASGEECVGPLITIAIAKAEEWYGRKGSKWQTLPELMLTYRAAAFWTRIFAPELALGIQTAEESVDMGPIDAEFEIVESPNPPESARAANGSKATLDELRAKLDRTRDRVAQEKQAEAGGETAEAPQGVQLPDWDKDSSIPADPDNGPEAEHKGNGQGEKTPYEKAKGEYFATWTKVATEGMAGARPLSDLMTAAGIDEFRKTWQEEHLGKARASHFSEDDYRKGTEMLKTGIGLATEKVGAGTQDAGDLPI